MLEEKRKSLRGVWIVASVIAVCVAAVVYLASLHRRHVSREKWKDYDECGLV